MKVNGLNIRFCHIRPNPQETNVPNEVLHALEGDVPKAGTICTIVNEEDGSCTARASSVHYRDQFCKATGRKVSLQKALVPFNFTKAEKKAIWKAYKERFEPHLLVKESKRKKVTAD